MKLNLALKKSLSQYGSSAGGRKSPKRFKSVGSAGKRQARAGSPAPRTVRSYRPKSLGHY